jgi:hypothetical protein
MAIALARVFPRTPTRIRCFFTDTVTAAPSGAFTVGSLGPVDFIDPPVVEALIVQGSQVELTVSHELAAGGNYELHLTGGQVHGGTPTAPGATIAFTVSSPPLAPSGQLSIALLTSNLFGEDISWNGTDWVETQDGDLAITTGPENARQAIIRREFSEGLLWDPSYGLKPNEFVDGPAGELPTLAARAETQALSDDRMKTASAKLLGASPTDPEDQVISVDLTLVDGSTVNVQTTVAAG